MRSLDLYQKLGLNFIQDLPNESASAVALVELLEQTNYDPALKHQIKLTCTISMENIISAPISFEHRMLLLELRIFEKVSSLDPLGNYLSSRKCTERLKSNFDEEIQLVARAALKYKNSCSSVQEHLQSWFVECISKITITIGKLSQYISPSSNTIDVAKVFTLYSVVDWLGSNIKTTHIGPTLDLALDLIAEDIYGNRIKALKQTAGALGCLGDENYWISALPVYNSNLKMELPEL